MKKVLACLAISACFMAGAQELYVFSADGASVGSRPRELPSQGFDRATGRVVVGLHARTDAERAACGWWRVVATPRPGVAASNEYWAVCGYSFTNGTAVTRWEKRRRKAGGRK